MLPSRVTQPFSGIASRQQFEESNELANLREKELKIARAEWRLVSEDELTDAQKELAVAQRQTEEAEDRLRVLEAGTRKETIEAMQAEIVRLQTQRRYVGEQAQRVSIVSLASGASAKMSGTRILPR
jgi:hypothetical protein